MLHNIIDFVQRFLAFLVRTRPGLEALCALFTLTYADNYGLVNHCLESHYIQLGIFSYRFFMLSSLSELLFESIATSDGPSIHSQHNCSSCNRSQRSYTSSYWIWSRL